MPLTFKTLNLQDLLIRALWTVVVLSLGVGMLHTWALQEAGHQLNLFQATGQILGNTWWLFLLLVLNYQLKPVQKQG